MIVYDHALQNYLERVLNLEEEQAGERIQEFAKEQIILAARSPEIIYRREQMEPNTPDRDEDCPIHVRNGCAVPVKEDEEDGTIFIPTVYKAGVFLSKIRTHEPAKARG